MLSKERNAQQSSQLELAYDANVQPAYKKNDVPFYADKECSNAIRNGDDILQKISTAKRNELARVLSEFQDNHLPDGSYYSKQQEKDDERIKHYLNCLKAKNTKGYGWNVELMPSERQVLEQWLKERYGCN